MTQLDRGTRFLAAAAAILASTAAALAAAGSHLLARKLDGAELASFNTAVAFQFMNSIGLFAFAWARTTLAGSTLVRTCGWLLLAGVALFCGSIYAARLGLTASAGATAPIGGTAVIVAWAGLAVGFLRANGR